MTREAPDSAGEDYMATMGDRPLETTERIEGEQSRRVQAASALLKQLSDPVRLRILGRLAQGEADAGALSAELGESRPAVSHHLALLRHSGMVAPRREGKSHYYQLTGKGRSLLEATSSLTNEPAVDRGPDEPSPPAGAPELVFQSTEAFEADVARLAARERSRITDEINARSLLLLTDRDQFDRGISRPFAPRLARGLDSTLFVMRIDRDLRVIFALDDDPLFGRIALTLLRLVRRHGVDDAYREVVVDLYRGLEIGGQGE